MNMRYLLTLLLIHLIYFSFGQTGYTEHVKLMYRHESSRTSQMLEFDLLQFIQKNQDLKQLPKSKKVKKLTIAVEKHFFRQYAEFANFSEIDAYGIYTPVTSAILMGIIFDAFEISYAIRVSSIQVDLIAYPKTNPITWNCGHKANSIYYWTDIPLSMVVNHILRSELTTETKIRKIGLQEYINQKFTELNDVSLNELIGMYYFNKSMEMAEEGRKEKALTWVKLATELYENENLDHLKAALLNDILIDLEKTDLKIPEYITTLYALTPDTKTKESIISSFEYYYQDALVDREDTSFVNLCDEWIQTNLSDHEDYNLFLSFTKYIKAYKMSFNGDVNESLALLKEAIYLNPENHHYKDALGQHIVRVAIKNETDEKEFMDSIKVYQKTYPFLTESTYYTEFVFAFLYMYLDDVFLINNDELGFEILALLETFPKYDSISETERIITYKASSYSEIATYYYRQKEYEKALSWIEKAEKLNPDDDLIESRGDRIREKVKK